MSRFEYDLPNNCAGALMDELNASGIQPQQLESRDNLVWVTVPDALEAQVSAVVNAHDGPAGLAAVAWEAVRVDRNLRLVACDWTALVDCPLSDADKALWAAYRQTLRDIPQAQADPTDITWPASP